MALNQFAKISPVVNSKGFLLEKDQDGKYSIASTIRLKDNETGICIDDNSILVMFEGKPVKLRGGVFETMSEALEYVYMNTSGDSDGQLICIKNNPLQLYVIIGTQLYNLTEQTTKTVVVNVPLESVTDNLFNIIENSVMQDNYSKKYLINNIDIKIPGENYTFYNTVSNINSEGIEEIINTKIDFPVFKFTGTKSGFTEIEINQDCYSGITKCMIDKEFKGKLIFSMDASTLDTFNGTLINRYEGNQISIIITYTPLYTD